MKNSILIQIAKNSVEAIARNESYKPSADEIKESEKFNFAEGVFVTIFTNQNPENDLRGCIGRFQRKYKSIAEDVAECAVESATQDPRFEKIEAGELPYLSYEISLLDKPVPINSEKELDCKKYGVIVESGYRRGTLLPDLEGVDTVKEQLSIARRKAGIGPNEPIKMFRYHVTKIKS